MEFLNCLRRRHAHTHNTSLRTTNPSSPMVAVCSPWGMRDYIEGFFSVLDTWVLLPDMTRDTCERSSQA